MRNVLIAIGVSFLAGVDLQAAPAGTAVANAAPTAAQLSFFESRIRPVLVSRCYECHSAQAKKVKGGLLLDSKVGMLRGGDNGAAVIPGNPDASPLITAIRYKDSDKQMPPKEQLGASVIADFEKWIAMGAPDPREGGTRAGAAAMPDPRKWWSFQPVKKATPPTVKDTAWPRGDIDKFVLAPLEEKGMTPAADANKGTLLRRVYFDVTGLPPTPVELKEFQDDDSANALEKVVDRLLASPQYGERWGRHWLDVARYAESTGKERNFPFPDAWRYRDYVIQAFNEDKPYDQFIREQIAGDLLPAKNAAERNEHLIATGFLAIGPKGLNEKNHEQFRMDEIDEQIDTSSRAILAMTIACARCHDHKFDPFTMKDYYGIAGIFRSTETYFGVNGSDGQKNRQPSPPLDLVAEDWRPGMTEIARPTKEKDIGPLKKVAKNGKKKGGAEQAPPVTADASGEHAMGVLDGRAADCPMYVRGEVENVGPVVPRALPMILNAPWAPHLNPTHSGRLELAQFMTRPENPLTARVMVNRIWQNLFGKGLVSTSDNFGATGEMPTHPELLDYLSGQFVNNGWSVKKLVRQIVLSRAYAMSSDLNPKGFEKDPENRLVWRANPRRLDAESIRDSILAVSGDIELTPPNAKESATAVKIGKGKAGKKSPVASEDSPHRSIYLPIIRDKLPDVLELFDFAEPSLVVPNRDVTTVPSQALFMMNSPFIEKQSAAMAKKLLSETTSLNEEGRIQTAYLMAFERLPTSAEETRAKAYLVRSTSEFKMSNEKAWATLCQVMFASAEFRYVN